MLTGYCYSQSDNLVCPLLSFNARFTPDFGYCHSISTDIFPLFRGSSGFQSSVPLSGNSSTSYSRHYITASYPS